MLAPRWPPLHGREILLAPNTVAASHARETITPALPPGAPCNWSSLPSARESLQAFGQSMHCQGTAECRWYALRSGSFCGSLRLSIGSAQTAGKKRSEFGSRSSEARHHGTNRTAQNTGDLLVGQLSVQKPRQNRPVAGLVTQSELLQFKDYDCPQGSGLLAPAMQPCLNATADLGWIRNLLAFIGTFTFRR